MSTGSLDKVAYPDYWVTYLITYTNKGDFTGTLVTLSDTLPAGLQDIVLITSGMPLTQTSSEPLIYDVADIPPGQGGQVTITARFPDDGIGISLTNTAEIFSAGEPLISQGDNRAEAAIPLPKPDLSISKQGNLSGFFHTGIHATYIISFTNQGDLTATQVLISDTLTVDLTDVGVSTSSVTISQISSDPMKFEVGELPVGTGGQITITGLVTPGFFGILDNAVEITSLEESQATQSNNRALSVLEIFPYNLFPLIVNGASN